MPVLIGGLQGISFLHRSPAPVELRSTVPIFALALLVAVFLQFAANYANDFCDNKIGNASKKRPELPVLAAKRRFLFCLTMAALCGASLVSAAQVSWVAKGVLLAIGGVCLAASWLYSGSKRPYCNLPGAAELVSGAAFGCVGGIGTFFIITAGAGLPVFLLPIALKSVSIGTIVSCQLFLDNLRDVETDPKFGKITLPQILGPERARKTYFAAVAFALICAVIPVFLTGSLFLINAALFLLLGAIFANQISNFKTFTPQNFHRVFLFNSLFGLVLGLFLIF